MEGVLERIRNVSAGCISKFQYESALFWADKAASLSQYEACDVYHLAQCMFHMKQYDRAALLIIRRQLHLKHSVFRYLAAKCYAEAKQWQAALDLLEGCQKDPNISLSKKLPSTESVNGIPDDKEMLTSLHLLRGNIYEAMEVREIAAECYKDALKADIFCYEAFERLIGHHMLRADEEKELLESLPMSDLCKGVEEEELVRFLYKTKLKKYDKPGEFEVPDSADNLHENLDVATSLAERHYYNCEFRTSYKITEGILKSDPYHPSCLPLHVALLVELKETNKLFYLAHQLVGKYPDLPISWYAVGCYYLLQPKKQELARRYLLKTTLLDRMYGPAWLAYGHSFASQNEHDQAMAAYFTASQLMRGCHLPFLYIGLEYSVTNNTKLAEKFFSSALEISQDDPHALHEMGVAAYTNKDLQSALKYFNKALELIRILGEEIHIEEWGPLLNNLGHTHRKLKNYDQALDYHRQALILMPHSAETYSAIGFVYAYMGNYLESIEYLHKSLGLRRDDAFTSNLLDYVVEQFAEADKPIYGDIESEEAYPIPTMDINFKIDDYSTPPSSVKPSGGSDITPEDDSKPFGDVATLSTPVSGVTTIPTIAEGRGVMMAWSESNSTLSDAHTSTSTTQTPHTARMQTKSFTGDMVFSTDDDMDLDDSINS
ncbi:cell division cycle protein 16 homolog [Clavelina lepadiformis]|uniref:cell division cycle protein 16 homolog n=1 Tax=Clavelina lepadiformis TaxID=159417 RepID=UPI00404321BF